MTSSCIDIVNAIVNDMLNLEWDKNTSRPEVVALVIPTDDVFCFEYKCAGEFHTIGFL